ncbi:MAG: hypothetical protein ACJ8AO_19400 [Gemmatimonadaceae bacterium]
MSTHAGLRVSLAASAAITAGLALAACADTTPVAPSSRTAPALSAAGSAQYNAALAELRRVTARYHDIRAAIDDDFIPVTAACAEEEGGEIMPIPYAHIGRLFDGRLDTSLPDALLYEPGPGGAMTLVGVELAIPFSQWTDAAPPTFFGAEYQREEELGVYGLHIWVWKHNPEGMLAEGNPLVTCDAG